MPPSRRLHAPGGSSAGETLSEPAQAEHPPIGAPDGVAQLLPPLRVTLQVAVLKLDAGPAGGFGHEAHFHLAGLPGICLDLPLGADVPADHDAGGWLIGQHARPMTLAAVDAAV